MRDSLTLTRRKEGFWLYRQSVVSLAIPVTECERRDLTERILSHLLRYLPVLDTRIDATGELRSMRGRVKRTQSGASSEQLVTLTGALVKASGSEDDDRQDDPEKIPFQIRTLTNFEAHEDSSVVFEVSHECSSSVKEIVSRCSLLDVSRNVAVMVNSFSITFEKFFYSSVIAKWCQLPTIDFVFDLTMNESGLMLEARVGKGVSRASLEPLETTFRLLFSSYGVQDELSKSLDAIMNDIVVVT